MTEKKDYSKPTKNSSQCSRGWFGLTKAGYATCKKCGAKRGEVCKALKWNKRGIANG